MVRNVEYPLVFGLGGTVNLFSGQGFEPFVRVGARAIVVAFKQDKALPWDIGLDAGLDVRYLHVTPAKFGMPPGSFQGGHEVVPGFFVAVFKTRAASPPAAAQ